MAKEAFSMRRVTLEYLKIFEEATIQPEDDLKRID
jgi:hypothetical protein